MTDPQNANHDELGLATAAMDAYQIEVAKELFEWWWQTGISPESIAVMPQFDAAADRIQAFWMDGAWRAIRVG